MNISFNWLKEFLNIDIDIEEVSNILTDIGLEVEGIDDFQEIKGGFKGLLVGEVVSCIKHPNADRLKLTTVNIGEESLLQIVCGAPNVKEGLIVVIATVGTTLYPLKGNEFKINKSKIRGELSQGMICAEDEIGIGKAHDGIIVLDKKHKPGTKVFEIFDNYSDSIFNIGLTPNRSDAMSHHGVARDLRAALMHKGLKTELLTPSVSNFHINSRTKKINIKISNQSLCQRFSGVCIENIKVESSPKWLQNKLKSIGLSPVNNVVDITNYILHELGQPLHAYDLEKIKSNTIEVKTLKEDTAFTTLDGLERKLNETDLMVCDKNKPMCIAGVYGGDYHGVSNETKSIFLESAYFNPVSIRKTAKAHSINSDASFRFERGVNIELVEYALKRAAILICEFCGGKICSDLIDEYPKKTESKSILLNFEKTNKLIGQEIPTEEIKSILTSLDFKINNITETGVGITVPSYRHDVTRECDVVEEILRIYGFNEINLSNKLSISLNTIDQNKHFKTESIISSYLNSLGFNEIMNNSLTNNELDIEKRKSVKIINSISSDVSQLRTSLLESSLKTLKYNLNRKNSNTNFYEFGKIYENTLENNKESRRLGILFSGNIIEKTWNSDVVKADFYTLKNIVLNIFKRLSINVSEKTMNFEGLENVLGMFKNDKRIAVLGEVTKEYKSIIGINQDVYYASIDIDLLLNNLTSELHKYMNISKFPSVNRELNFLFNNDIHYSEIEILLFQNSKIKKLISMSLSDVYIDKKLPEGKKSYTLSFRLMDNEKTLTEKEIQSTMNKIQNIIENKFIATLRS
ncbi:MAG: phenylalanine--tRNA ligase subunit beta [Flavobacteriales bacterium]|jgi:phenylalanyl-tRNA synthetase beta chain|tara:strand:- start:17842 stop:20256 length:2415 start_codon:yes stop_codon:yes gene_type:complete